MDLTGLFGAQGATPVTGYSMNGTTVMPAVAVDPAQSPNQIWGGQGMAMPTGSTALPTSGASGSAGGYSSILGGLFSGLADAYKGYAQGSAQKNQQVASQVPMAYQPVTTQFPFKALPQEPQITRG